MKNTLTSKILMVIAGLIIAIFLTIFLLFCFTDATISQEKPKEKKISMIQYSKSKEFLTKEITHAIVHWGYNDTGNIQMIIDSVFILEGN